MKLKSDPRKLAKVLTKGTSHWRRKSPVALRFLLQQTFTKRLSKQYTFRDRNNEVAIFDSMSASVCNNFLIMYLSVVDKHETVFSVRIEFYIVNDGRCWNVTCTELLINVVESKVDPENINRPCIFDVVDDTYDVEGEQMLKDDVHNLFQEASEKVQRVFSDVSSSFLLGIRALNALTESIRHMGFECRLISPDQASTTSPYILSVDASYGKEKGKGFSAVCFFTPDMFDNVIFLRALFMKRGGAQKYTSYESLKEYQLVEFFQMNVSDGNGCIGSACRTVSELPFEKLKDYVVGDFPPDIEKQIAAVTK